MSEAQTRLAESSSLMGFRLLELLSGRVDGNLSLSPLSIAMALCLAMNGASGRTRGAIEEALGLAGLSPVEINQGYRLAIDRVERMDAAVRLEVANSVWHSSRVRMKAEFITLNQTYFDAEVVGMDFASPGIVEAINAWVVRATQGMIQHIVDSVDPMLHAMFLINALFFKGTWSHPFDRSATHEDHFRTGGGTESKCMMMEQMRYMPYAEGSGYQAVDLPYGEGHFSMTVVLPLEGKGVDNLVQELGQAWGGLLNRLSPTNVLLEMPRLTLDSRCDLKDSLSALGMGVAFRPEADFSLMSEEDLSIGEVVHKARIEVDEEGTRAAAATSVEMVATSADYISMRVDRPFILAVRERSAGTLLFLGKVADPGFSC